MALIYFLTADPALARKEAAEAGWMQVAINRWVTPDRNDIRIITSRRDFQLIPGGTLILPARDIAELPSIIDTETKALRKAEAVRDKRVSEGAEGKGLEPALLAVDAARRRLDRVTEIMADVRYFKQMVDAGSAQWIGNPLLGDDATQDLIDGIETPSPAVAA